MILNETIFKHSSVRHFTDEKISREVRENLIRAAQSASSSNFLQAYSLIRITDLEKRKIIEKTANFLVDNGDKGEMYIFVADLNKHFQILKENNKSTEHLKSIESLEVAVIDTALAAQSMAIYAESIGLGICYVGGIRNDLFLLKNLLDLPQFTYPLFALMVGYPAIINDVKPRIPMESILLENSYQYFDKEKINKYDNITQEYYKNRGSNVQSTDWSIKICQHYSKAQRKETLDFLKKQGFEF